MSRWFLFLGSVNGFLAVAMGAVFATLVSYWFAVHGSCFMFKTLRPTGRMMSRALLYPKVW